MVLEIKILTASRKVQSQKGLGRHNSGVRLCIPEPLHQPVSGVSQTMHNKACYIPISVQVDDVRCAQWNPEVGSTRGKLMSLN
jgi:hypothetical protein